jgi:hypothetical protein
MQTFSEWRGKRGDSKQVFNHWQSLPPPGVVPITPKPHDHYGTSMDEDTIRVTGSQAFVDSVMTRLKDLMALQQPGIALEVTYKPTKYTHAGGLMPNYIFNFSARYTDPHAKIPRGPVPRA